VAFARIFPVLALSMVAVVSAKIAIPVATSASMVPELALSVTPPLASIPNLSPEMVPEFVPVNVVAMIASPFVPFA
jgi:hypothetical protein